jgi:hypothetical protein
MVRDKAYITIILILIILLAFSLIRINTLESENSVLDRRVRSLESRIASNATGYQRLEYNYTVLRSLYSSLTEKYRVLTAEYSRLNKSYAEAARELRDARLSLSRALRILSQLTVTLDKASEKTIEATMIPQAFRRVLNYLEVYRVRSTVESIIRDKDNFWMSIEDIYYYITEHIVYVKDTDHLIILVNHTNIDGSRVAYKVDYYWIRNYVQTPYETLTMGQGDCDDQAVLAYAMIKYYMVNMRLHDQPLYFAKFIMADGSAHTTVILPIGNGNITIIDPAGHYLTIYITLMNSRPAIDELESYSYYWEDHGGISLVYLYTINITDGSYSLVASGSIYSVGEYLETHG